MTHWLQDDLNERRRRGLYRRRRRPTSAQGAHLTLQGRTLLNFSSNDYLNLAADPRLARAAARAARRYGCGAGASPLVSGYLPPLRALERALARWESCASALVFSSGFAANLAVVSALAGREDVLFSDERNHASLIDGCRLTRARLHIYRHGDANHLADLLRSHASTARRRLIVSDTIFSMDGDLAPLPALYDLAERHEAVLLLDEAHATGVLGEHGCGATELFPPPRSLDPEALFKVGTLSKALGTQGGFVCGTKRQINWLLNHARPYIFSTALAPPLAAAAHQAIQLVKNDPQRRLELLTQAEWLRSQLKEQGWQVGASQCQILPVLLGEPRRAVQVSRILQRANILVPAIRPPSVPQGTSRLRISLTAGHTRDDLAGLLTALAGCL